MMKTIYFIAVMLLIATASSDVYLATDFKTDNGYTSSYSEGPDHKMSVEFNGAGEYSIVNDVTSPGNSSTWSGFNSLDNKTLASYSAKSNEYSVNVKDARNLHATVLLHRERTVEFAEEVITEVTNDSLVQTTEQVFTTSNANVDISGNGSIREHITISSAGRARVYDLRDFSSVGNFSLNTTFTADGQQIKRSFGVIDEETKSFNRVIRPTDDSMVI